jgi:hypothetical protein
MSHLTNKSDINRAAADLLQTNYYYPSVIHCSYYSCIQLMKHIFLFILNKSEVDLESEGRTTGTGSHEVLINSINTHLKTNNKDWKTFNTNINQLKRLRVAADYQDIEIDSGKGNDSILLSDIVLKFLKSNVKI